MIQYPFGQIRSISKVRRKANGTPVGGARLAPVINWVFPMTEDRKGTSLEYSLGDFYVNRILRSIPQKIFDLDVKMAKVLFDIQASMDPTDV
jgi:hypothetical protein